LECIKRICNQTRSVEAIYIIDNASTDGTGQALFDKGYIPVLPPENLQKRWEYESNFKLVSKNIDIKIYYLRLNKNLGGAGGFYEGIKAGYEKEYEWLWLMDDDGSPDNECLEKLLRFRDEAHFICPLVLLKKNDNHLSFGLIDYENRKKKLRVS